MKSRMSKTAGGKSNKFKEFLFGSLIGIFFIFLGIATYDLIQNYSKNQYIAQHPLETKKTIVKVLPPEVKKQLSMASPSATFRVPILLYHYVEIVTDIKDTKRESLNISPFTFEQQVKTLKDAGYTFMTASDLGNVFDGKTKMPDKPVLITFDDGHWDFDTVVLPILKKYKAKATQYVIPGFTGGSDFMSQSQVQDIVNSGLVDVGAHTVHHLALKGRPYDIVQKEIDDSKIMLENTYHIKVVSFAYPYGSFDLQAEQLVKDDGFTTAVSTVPGIEQNQNNRFFLYRLRPGYRTGQSLLTYISQNYFKEY